MPKLVLFDLDGTLINAGGAGRNALNKAVSGLYGCDDVCSRFSIAGRTDKDNFTQAFIHARGKKPSKKDLDTLTEEYLGLLPGEVAKSVKAKKYVKINGVEQFIKWLRRNGMLVGLGTGNLKEGAYIKLGPSGLGDSFEFGGFGADGYERADMLVAAVRRAEKHCGSKIAPEDVYVIGDTSMDIFAAKDCGFHTAAITTGYGTEAELNKAAPELMEPDFSDMSGWSLWLGVSKDPKGVERSSYICPDTAIDHVYFARTGVDEKQVEIMRRLRTDGKK